MINKPSTSILPVILAKFLHNNLTKVCNTSNISFTNCALLCTVLVVLDLVSQIRDVVLMNVYLDLGNPGGSGF
jgi:hypothetical protein